MSATARNAVSAPEQVWIVLHHHSDLVWRRTRRGYDRVREVQLLQVMDCMRRYPELRFTIAQSDIVKTFLREHPELDAEVRSLVSDGRLELVGGGVGIPDTNLPCGEAILRNFMLGKSYYREQFGVEVETAWLMDAFGMSGQLPQILRGLGFRYVYPGRMPGLAVPDTGYAFCWHGIDRTGIIAVRENCGVQQITHICNLPITFSPQERIRASLEKMADCPGSVFGFYSTEECLFMEEVFSLLPEMSERTGKHYTLATVRDVVAGVDPDGLEQVHGEFNPEFTGCYTTRIRIKQLNRRAEAALFAAEAVNALAGIAGGQPYPAERLRGLWERLFVCQFHDGICGCHVSAVADELDDDYHHIIAGAEVMSGVGMAAMTRPDKAGAGADSLLLFNPTLDERDEVVFLRGTPLQAPLDADGNLLPAQQDGDCLAVRLRVGGMKLSSISFSVEEASGPRITHNPGKLDLDLPYYRVGYESGSLEIEPKFMQLNPLAGTGFGEIRFREERGDLWTEELCGPVYGVDDCEETIERVEEGPVFTRILLHGAVLPRARAFHGSGSWEGFESLEWEKEWLFFRDVREFRLRLTLLWKGNNTHVAVDFPLTIDPLQATATYEVPFGCVSREPYYEVPCRVRKTARDFDAGVLSRAKGDWPALGWVDYSDRNAGLTLANSGTPGHQLKAGSITVSLLRSPTRMGSHFLPEPDAWDNGKRVYDFRLLPHEGGLSAAAPRLGRAANHPFVVCGPLPHLSSGSVRYEDDPLVGIDRPEIALSALKRAEDGSGFILRVYECMGRACEAEVSFCEKVKNVWSTDMNEKVLEPITGNKLTFRPFEIKTLMLQV